MPEFRLSISIVVSKPRLNQSRGALPTPDSDGFCSIFFKLRLN